MSFSTFSEGIDGNRAAPTDLLASFQVLRHRACSRSSRSGDLSGVSEIFFFSSAFQATLVSSRAGAVSFNAGLVVASVALAAVLSASSDAGNPIQIRLGLLLPETMRRLRQWLRLELRAFVERLELRLPPRVGLVASFVLLLLVAVDALEASGLQALCCA